MGIVKDFYDNAEQYENYYFNGIAVGVVTDIDDPEKRSRLKVKILMRDSSEFETDYIRVMTPMTGKEWGMFTFPEVGDEVILAFAGGDMTRPYVLGSLCNQDYKAPIEIQDGKNITRQIKTKCGHELTFHDEDGKEHIEVKTPKSLTILVDDEAEKIELRDKNQKNLMKIDSKNGIVTINAEKKIVIKTGNATIEMDGSSNQITMESNQSIQLKSQQISINAKGSLELKASSNMNIKTDGVLSMKGAVAKLN